MAQKIEPITVTAPSGEEMGRVGAGAVKRMGGAAATGNVAGRTTQLAGLLSLLGDGGAAALDPALLREYASLQRSTEKATRGARRNLNKLATRRTNAQAELEYLQGLKEKGETLTRAQETKLARLPKQIADIDKKSEPLQGRVDAQNKRVSDFQSGTLQQAPKATELLQEKFPELNAAVAEAAPYLDKMGTLGATGEQLMSALTSGFQGRDITADQVRAATLGDFGSARSRDISAAQVGAGSLGQSLMSEAQRRIALQGQLSPEASRDAVQAARQGMASRGMATGNASLAAELLNRDRYSRQRGFQDLSFAQGVQSQDLGRQFQNVGNQLAAAQSNQSAAMQAELANLQARYNASVQKGNWEMAAQERNQAANLQAAIASEESRRLGTQLNNSMLGQAFTTEKMVNQEGLGAALQRSQIAGAANPNSMLLNMYGAGEPTGSQALPGAASMANTWATNQLGANTFNANSQMWANAANMYQPGGMQSGMGFNAGGAATGALSGAAAGAVIGSVVPGVGTAVGAGAGALIGGAGGGFSS